MSARLLLTLTLAATAALAPVAAADAATRAPYPSVTSISPLNLGIGDTMTISGRNFVAGKLKNTVVFKRDGKRAMFVKADTATRSKITVVIPEKLRSALGRKNGAAVPSKFRVRVLARRFARTYSRSAKSPTIGPRSVTAAKKVEEAKRLAEQQAAAGATSVVPPSDCDGDGVIDSADADDDNDLMTDAFELSIRTNACAADSDGDGMWDVYEYTAAIDLNAFALPYPGKRPHPNPLDGSDGRTDYDGDGMSASQEHAMWARYGGRVLPLNYSDGKQRTGPAQPVPATAPHLDVPHGGRPADGILSDDEKDVDGDGLSNFVEANQRLQPSYWTTFKPYADETAYPVAYDGTDYLERDSDGDSEPDGTDDQDFDGYNNIFETYRGPYYVHPFNPCMPDVTSRTCAFYLISDVAENPFPPFKNADHMYDHDGSPLTAPIVRPMPMRFDPTTGQVLNGP